MGPSGTYDALGRMEAHAPLGFDWPGRGRMAVLVIGETGGVLAQRDQSEAITFYNR